MIRWQYVGDFPLLFFSLTDHFVMPNDLFLLCLERSYSERNGASCCVGRGEIETQNIILSDELTILKVTVYWKMVYISTYGEMW